ncbi:MAG TPA: helix-turn-helix domain-containing protein [Candidatus Limnocylindrales bacterium]|jgi:transcriptional regulator with XRE-family HTH domain
MDDARVGAALRAVRIRSGWRQRDVAERAGVSRGLVSSIERGHLDDVTLARLRQVAHAIDVRVVTLARWRGGDLDRLVNAAHEALREEVARLLAELPGWVQAPEVSFSVYGERGVIDILALHAPTRSLLIVELKTEIASIEDLLVTMDRRTRLAVGIARERGWEAATVSGWVVVAASDMNRRRARAHATTLRSAFPADGHAMRAWLRQPSGRISGLSFWANSSRSSVTRRTAARKRVRRPAGGSNRR